MATFYTARHGWRHKGQDLQTIMSQVLDKDVVEINQRHLVLDEPVPLKSNITIQGSEGGPRPVITGPSRQLTFNGNNSQLNGTITFRHLAIELPDSSQGIRIASTAGVRLILEDVMIYHTKDCETPYPAIYLDTEGTASVELTDSVIDIVSGSVGQLTITRSSLGDWYSDASQFFFSQGRIVDSGLQNILLQGQNDQAQLQLQNVEVGGNTNLKQVTANGQGIGLVQLPSVNHVSRKVDKESLKADSTSLILQAGSRVQLERVHTSLEQVESKWDLPKWRNLGLAGGELVINNAQLQNSGLKSIARSGGIRMENTQDDSQWEIQGQVKLANRNSHSELFQAQDKLATAAMSAAQPGQSKQAMEALNEMIGLTGVKNQVTQIIRKAKMDAERQRRGVGTSKAKTTLHMVFAGSAGTGKTTVARLVAQALYENGVLKSPNMTEVRQADLVGQHVGETAPKTKGVIRSALDGVLFIDEAYELAPPVGGGNTFNNEAVTELIADMENYSNRLVVIMAGYTQEMADFFRRGNPGLQSRFANWIEFPDYTPQELKQIERYTLKKVGARFNDVQTVRTIDQGIDDLLPIVSRTRAGGNGRFVRNYIQRICEMRDNRLAEQDISQLSDEQLLIIEPQDVHQAVAVMQQQITNMQQ